MAKISRRSLFPGISAQIRGKDRFFGGALLGPGPRSHAKSSRPLDSRAPVHLVLRSEYARGNWSLLRRAQQVQNLLQRLSTRHGVAVIDFANVGNHLHLVIKISSRRAYQRFIRAFSAAVSRAVTGAHKYKRVGLRFWQQRPFTRVLASGGRPLQLLRRYLAKNKLEALGFSSSSAHTLLSLGLTGKFLETG